MTVSPRVRVLIAATTEDPVEIEKLFKLPADLGMSTACVGNGSIKAPISDSYHRFVAAGTGIIEQRSGHKSWRLNLSSPIDTGESWQLGVFIAHELKDAGRLAERGEPAGTIIVATGEVHHDLSVAEISGLKDKLRCLIEFLTRQPAPGSHLIIAWPKLNQADVDEATRQKLRALGAAIIELAEVAPLLKELGLVKEEGSSNLVKLETKILERLKQLRRDFAVDLAALGKFLHVSVRVARIVVLTLVLVVGTIAGLGLAIVVKTKFGVVVAGGYLVCNYTSWDRFCKYLTSSHVPDLPGVLNKLNCKVGEYYNSSLKECRKIPSLEDLKFDPTCKNGEHYNNTFSRCMPDLNCKDGEFYFRSFETCLSLRPVHPNSSGPK